MGIDSTYYLPKKTNRKDLEEFLLILGYEKAPSPKSLKSLKATSFYYFSNEPYKSSQGVTFIVMIDEEEDKLIACGRNTIFRSKNDNDFHNYTLKQLRKRFDGYFISDYGKNRYFPFGDIDRKNDELGCYEETQNALGKLKKIKVLTGSLNEHPRPIQKTDLIWMNEFNPEVILSNLVIVHILSIIENFFRNTYIALLTFSEIKTEIIKANYIKNLDLLEVGKRNMSLEQAFANSLNFQNIELICENFNKLDQNLAIKQELKKKIGRKKESFYNFIERIAAQRHRYVHHNQFYLDYDLELFKKDLKFCELLIDHIYKNITNRKKWTYKKIY